MISLGHHCNRTEHLSTIVTANGLDRVEVYNLDPDSRPTFRTWLRDTGCRLSVHAPLYRKEWYPWPPTWSFLHDADPDRRNLSLRLVRETIAESGDLGAEFVVVHFPTPLGGHPGEPASVRERAMDAAWQMNRWAEEAGTDVAIEGFGPNPLLEPGFLTEVCTTFPRLGYCWDSGHMHYHALRDGFDYEGMATALLPHIRSLQLWSSQTEEQYRANGHVPVHPRLGPADGWVDIDLTLRVLAPALPTAPVILEAPPRFPDSLGELDYREGIQWIRSLLGDISS